jgi:hypothetical protein
MLKLTKYIMLACLIFTQQACVKDLQDDINDGGWNHERTVIDIQFENQMGKAVIKTVNATTGKINLAINVGAVSDLSNIKLKKIQLSYQAISSLKVGDAMSFDNASHSASFTVTATTGEQREYTITVSEFTETLEGVWDVQKLTVYGGTGPEYGGGAVMELAEKPWCWSETNGPKTECDNILTFTMTGVTDDGNTSGTCVNDAGADGKYADFIFLGSGNKENPGLDIDLKKFYRQIPEGESRWIRDYSTNTITFTDRNGRTTTGALVSAGIEDLGYGKTMTIAKSAFAFNLNGTDDWTNIYTDYDKFVKKVRRYWISVSKR